jgi:hypothetical protein
MIRSIFFSFALSTNASAVFPVLMNEQVPTVNRGRYTIDATRDGHAIVASDYTADTVFHRLDGRNDTPTLPTRISRGNGTIWPIVFATANGSHWIAELGGQTFVSPDPPTRRYYAWNFDQNGALIGMLDRILSRETKFVKNDLGVLGITSSLIVNIETGLSSRIDICRDSSGMNLSPCRALASYAGIDEDVWIPRYVGSNANGRVQLVRFNARGEQVQTRDLIASATLPEVTLTRMFGELRVSVIDADQTVLFNVSDRQGFQIQFAGRVNGRNFSAPLGDGNWLLSAASTNPTTTHATLAPFNGFPKLQPRATQFHGELS